MFIGGKCLCGGVVYRINGELPTHDGNLPIPVMCHCTFCQQQTGSAFATVTMAPISQFVIVQGDELIKRYESSVGNFRSFCGHCGSMLFYIQTNEPYQIYFSLGTVENCTLKPQSHIFVRSKAAWHDIQDNLPKFEKYP